MASKSSEAMHLHTALRPSALSQTAIEVTIQEEHLLRNKTHVARTLCAYSLDNGPWHETDDARFIFRFTAFDWLNNVEDILRREHIHCDDVRRFEMDVQACAKKIAIVGCESECDLPSALEAAGYRVQCYAHGKAVIERCWSPVDLFIIEKQSPDIDGLSICRHLRAHPLTKNIPIILLSAEAMKGSEALLAGATDYVKKPFHIHYLLNVIAAHVERGGYSS